MMWPMMLLGDVAGDPMVSGAWVTTLVVAVIGALAAAFTGGRKSARMTLEEPVPTIPTRKVSQPPSWDQHTALSDRVARLEHAQAEARREQAEQYRELMESQQQRELRLMEKLDGIARGIHHRVDEVIASSHHNPNPGSKR